MKKAIIILFLLSTVFVSEAQKRDTTLFKQVVNHSLIDVKEYAISPIHWDKKDWLVFSGFAVTTGALIAWGDQSIYDFSNTLHTTSLDKLSNAIEPIGNTYAYIVMGGTLLGGIIKKDNYATETAAIAFESFLFSSIVNRTVKTLAGRARPNYYNDTNAHQWYGPLIENPIKNHVSFFSGHTTVTFSIASVYAYRYNDIKWIPYLAYGLATIGGLQRIYDNRHWASDVLTGAVFGTATGIFLCKQWENNSSIKFFPTYTTNGAGLFLIIPIN